MKFLILVIAITLFHSSCKKNTGGDTPLPPKTEMNVAYGADPKQKMDVYLPQGRSVNTTKVMIMIHGGGWAEGDKADFTAYVDSLKKRLPDYAVFNINYRLASTTGNFFPTQENDVKAAVEFIFNKRTEYGISDKFVYLGGSAGGHLALLQAYKHTTVVKPKAVIDFFGPTDLVAMYNNPGNPLIPLLLTQVLTGTPATQAALYTSSSPINFITAQSSPTLIFHGGTDIVVPVAQSTALKTKLETMGVVNQYVFYPTEGHGWMGPNLVDSFNKIALFLAANVN